jgi:hypothetical protein
MMVLIAKCEVLAEIMFFTLKNEKPNALVGRNWDFPTIASWYFVSHG